MTPEFAALAREIVHYEGVDLDEATEIMEYVARVGYPEDRVLTALSVGGWATLYYNAWLYRTFHLEVK